MKKIVLVLGLILTSITLNAQEKFTQGLRAGANYSRFTQIESTNERFTFDNDFYVGLFGKFQFTRKIAIMPSITYSRQGGNREAISNGNVLENNYALNYVALANTLKWNFGKAHLLVGPSIDILVRYNKKRLNTISNQFSTIGKPYFNDVDLAIECGAGVDITKSLALEFRFKHSISGASYSYDELQPFQGSISQTHTISNIVYQLGLAYSFNSRIKESKKTN
ncbi:MAG: PorT family protein [Flavobacteriales bacterium]|nr:PorT family protein [Flavobacteriales bacterium]